MSTCAQCGGPVSGGTYAGRGGAAYCCFGCLALGERDCGDSCAPAPELRGVGLRLGIAILVVGQSMIFGLALNLHDDVPRAARAFTQWMILAGTALVAALLGGPLVRTAWAELRRGRLTVEALFLLTAAGATAASLQAHLTGRGKIYFEVVSVLLVVYTPGKLIGARSRAAAVASTRAWGDRLGSCRLVDESGAQRTVKVEEVRPGDVVEVRPGELVAVDGVVREGFGFVSESAVSGEPFAVVRRPGDHVLAGSASSDATFRIEATAPGTAREIDRLLAAVEEAREKPLSLQARADALGRWFLPLVVSVALGTFAYWSFLTDAGWEAALFRAMSVLLVACPCVIGLATPVVIWSAISRLAERGVIVRGGDAVERLAGADCVMFDKTGTLTDDRFALVDIETAATGDGRAKLLGWLSLVQSHSSHPVAKPFAELPRSFADGAEPRVCSLVAVPGCGVVAELEEATGTRHQMKVGTPEWIEASLSERGAAYAFTSPLAGEVGEALRAGWGGATPLRGGSPPTRRRADSAATSPARGEVKGMAHTICVALDGELVAAATVAERLRDSAPQSLAHFAALGLPVEVLTGDSTARAEALGLPSARGGLLPDDKRAAVEVAKAAGARPLFVGDGINDASALAAAHCGVALAGGTDLAVSAAPVALYHADLRAIPWAVELSRDAVRAVRRNLSRALGYNLVGMALAACGVLHPVAAAVLMVLSSLTLIFSSTRVGHCVEPPSGAREPTAPRRTQWAYAPRSGCAPLGAALVHALAFALQGVALLALVDSLREPLSATSLVAAFALAGAALALIWRRLALPHWADMCLGMLTLGNLGMLLGWWADAGFAPLHGGCCACAEATRGGSFKPWMWVGMLASSNAAMLRLGRGSLPSGSHARAMFTGGNAGMVVGMAAGGWCAAQVEVESVAAAVALSFAGMTLGMLAGMLAGTWLAERLGAGLSAVGFVPRRLRITSSRTP
jgi:heavy metal translocating P-type ATPase